MKRLRAVLALASTLLALPACSSAYAEKPAAKRPGGGAYQQGVEPAASPYHVELVGEDGAVLPTYHFKGRFYIQGAIGQRYSVRVTNPTGQRVEAVISIDGLDAIDGKTADFVGKRGYIVPAYGTLTVDGFRVSLDEVAAFRFSSVRASYAGRKGQARNVGVVGVAIFAERAQPEPVYIPEEEQRPYDRYRGGEDDGRRGPAGHGGAPTKSAPKYDNSIDGDSGGADETGRAEPKPTTASPPPREDAPAAPTGGATGYGGGGKSAGAPSPVRPPMDKDAEQDSRCCNEVKKERGGLGTEFGERRGSPVTYTRFERGNATKPTAVAEIRYNDHDGLSALGIPFNDPVDSADLELRETANPFPNADYAPPPPGWR